MCHPGFRRRELALQTRPNTVRTAVVQANRQARNIRFANSFRTLRQRAGMVPQWPARVRQALLRRTPLTVQRRRMLNYWMTRNAGFTRNMATATLNNRYGASGQRRTSRYRPPYLRNQRPVYDLSTLR